jgi:prefoldin subunit 4
MVSFNTRLACRNLLLTRCQLTREEEEAMGEEKEVRKEDQDRINRFSRLHSREKLIEEDLKTKQASLIRL